MKAFTLQPAIPRSKKIQGVLTLSLFTTRWSGRRNSKTGKNGAFSSSRNPGCGPSLRLHVLLKHRWSRQPGSLHVIWWGWSRASRASFLERRTLILVSVRSQGPFIFAGLGGVSFPPLHSPSHTTLTLSLTHTHTYPDYSTTCFRRRPTTHEIPTQRGTKSAVRPFRPRGSHRCLIIAGPCAQAALGITSAIAQGVPSKRRREGGRKGRGVRVLRKINNRTPRLEDVCGGKQKGICKLSKSWFSVCCGWWCVFL